jgi:hypothetical protein
MMNWVAATVYSTGSPDDMPARGPERNCFILEFAVAVELRSAAAP